MATTPEITNILKILAAAYPTFGLKTPTSELYLRLLADLPGPLLHLAALDHISRSPYFPTIAELRQAAFDLLKNQPDQPLDAHTAWVEVLAAFDRTGYKGTPVFSHPLIGESVGALDWQALCKSDNPIADRSHFVQVYQQLLDRYQIERRRLPEVREKLLALNASSTPLLKEG